MSITHSTTEHSKISSNAIDQLVLGIREKRAPIVVGLDPVVERIPSFFFQGKNNDLRGITDAMRELCFSIIDAVCDIVPAVKPQSAFFEQYGSLGIGCLEDVISYAKERNLLVILDAKRGDIGHTAAAYAQAYLGEAPLLDGASIIHSRVDFLTVSPFLGLEGIDPFKDIAKEHGKGIFVLVRTSNSGSELVQGALTVQGKKVSQLLAEWLANESETDVGSYGYSLFGAVVGATHPEDFSSLRKTMPRSFFLIPGYGAQGGGAIDLAECFNQDGLGAIVSSSRGIIYAYEKTMNRHNCTKECFASATKGAAVEMIREIYKVVEQSCANICY